MSDARIEHLPRSTDRAPRPQQTPIEQLPRARTRIEHLRPTTDLPTPAPATDADRTVAPRPEADRTLAHRHRPADPRARGGRRSNSCPTPRSGSNTCAPPPTRQTPHRQRTPIEQLPRAPKRIEHLRPATDLPIPAPVAGADRTVVPRPEADRTPAPHHRPAKPRTGTGRRSNSCPARCDGSNTYAPRPTDKSSGPQRTPIEQLRRAPKRIEHLLPATDLPTPAPAADADRTVAPRPEADRTLTHHDRPTSPPAHSRRRSNSSPTPRSGSNTCAPTPTYQPPHR